MMAFPVRTFSAIRSDLLRDLKNILPEADVSGDSDYYVRATSIASAVEGLYQHQSWIVRQIFPDTADSEYLLMHAAVRGLSPKQATTAKGWIRITGQSGKYVPIGQAAKDADGRIYQTISDGYIQENGAVLLAAEAAELGTAGNAAEDTPVTLQAAPTGLESDALLTNMRGGVESETDTELLERLLDVIRRPAAGGNKYDYRRWAMEVDGVTDAYVYPLRRGLGTVDIAIISADGLPSAQTLKNVCDYIDSVRPVTAKNFIAIAPTVRIIDLAVSVKLTGTTLEEARAAIVQTVGSKLNRLAPGGTWIRSQAEAQISNVPGVVDRAISAPIKNVVPLVNENVIEWLRLGNITVTEML